MPPTYCASSPLIAQNLVKTILSLNCLDIEFFTKAHTTEQTLQFNKLLQQIESRHHLCEQIDMSGQRLSFLLSGLALQLCSHSWSARPTLHIDLNRNKCFQ